MGEVNRGIQIGTIIAVASLVFGGGGSAVLWAADQRYEKKGELQDDIDGLSKAVQANSASQEAQSRSVDALLLQILDMRIEDLEAEIRTLEAQDDLTPIEADHLSDARKALADAKTERANTFERVLGREK